jgi:uncharacterized protein (TIGR02466 family)
MTNQDLIIRLFFPKAIGEISNFLSNDDLEKIKKDSLTLFDKYGSSSSMFLNVDSTHQTNHQIHTHEEFNDFAVKVLNSVKLFAKQFNYDDNLISNLKILNMWINISEEGAFAFPHLHPNSMFSGAFYIEAPEDSFINFYESAGKSMFWPRPSILNDLSETEKMYDCITNQLLIFKSDVLHGNPKQPKGRKITISFNVISN